MKKVLFFFIAALTLMVVACNPDEKKDNGIDWNKVTVNGFYVAGPATGFNEISGDCVMAAGFNEADKAARDGMYEKYIVLEADKEFYLLYNDGGNKSRYSAALQEFETPEQEAYNDNPAKVFKGALVKGDDAPAMKVNKTGLYHIVLDINKTGDLDAAGGAQILLLDASAFQMMGAFGKAESDPAPATFSNKEGVTFTYKGVKLMKGAWFKFRTGDYWKVTLDDAGKVKAEVSLGDGMSQNGGNCSVDKSGIYDVTLQFKLAGGGFDRSFTMTTDLKQEVSEMPEWAGIYGDYSGHNWNTDGEEPIKIGAKKGEEGTGVFKGVVTMVGGTGFKVFANDVWYGGSMDNLGDGANLVMAEEGTFYVEIDLASDTKTIKFTKITRVGVIGDALATGWGEDVELAYDEEKHVFSGPITFVEGGSWKVRFNNGWDYSYGGTLEAPVYDGDNFANPGAGTYTVTADFTDAAAFTVEEGAPFVPAIAIDGDLTDWADIAEFTSAADSRIRKWKVTSDAKNVYVLLALRRDRADNSRKLTIGFNTDKDAATGKYSDDNNMKGCEAVAYKLVPFTNASGADPVGVNGVLTDAKVYSTAEAESAGPVNVFACDKEGDSDNVYLEVSIAKSALALPAGEIEIGASYDYYFAGYQAVTL